MIHIYAVVCLLPCPPPPNYTLAQEKVWCVINLSVCTMQIYRQCNLLIWSSNNGCSLAKIADKAIGLWSRPIGLWQPCGNMPLILARICHFNLKYLKLQQETLKIKKIGFKNNILCLHHLNISFALSLVSLPFLKLHTCLMLTFSLCWVSATATDTYANLVSVQSFESARSIGVEIKIKWKLSNEK